MKSNYIRPVVFNFGLFLALFVAFYFSCFLSGYASNNSYIGAEKKLYLFFFVVHLVLNASYLFLTKRFAVRIAAMTSIEIILLFTLTYILCF
jgi:hypothetical protein